MLELAFRPDRADPEPIYRQLAAHLRALIEARRLAPGEKLPASRELAAALGLSRNTVTQAYLALVDARLLEAHVGQGTFVTRAAAARTRAAGPEGEAPRGFVWEGLLAGRARVGLAAGDAAEGFGHEPRFELRPGRADVAALPGRALRAAWSRALRRLGELANRTEPLGWPPLRQALARGLVARGVGCDPDEILITNGAQQALDLLARALLDPGDAAVMEEPGYFGATLAFRAAQAIVIPVPVDGEGLRTDALERVLRTRRAKLVYTTPAVQCPTGVAMADTRRRALLELAEATHTPVVEDDYDGELRAGGPAVPALKTLDRAGQVIYVGTFSKAVFPALRVGYVVAPRPLLRRLAALKLAADLAAPLLVQAVLADWLASGGLERHVRRLRRVYRERLAEAREALAREMPEGTSVRAPAGGSALWVALPDGLSAPRLRAAARAQGVAVGAGELFHLDPADAAGHLHLSVASCEGAELREAVSRLGACARAAASEAATAHTALPHPAPRRAARAGGSR